MRDSIDALFSTPVVTVEVAESERYQDKPAGTEDQGYRDES